MHRGIQWSSSSIPPSQLTAPVAPTTMEENPNRSKTLLMPSPFPGMDPYVEIPDWFPCLHDCLIFGILESLQLRLPESYYAQSTQRVWLEWLSRLR